MEDGFVMDKKMQELNDKIEDKLCKMGKLIQEYLETCEEIKENENSRK